MSIQEDIIQKIKSIYKLEYLSVENESDQHHVPENSETHFKVVVVSEDFKGQSLLERQKKLYQLLETELKSGVHALSQNLWTLQEWKDRGATHGHPSPRCSHSANSSRK